jgi:hypothetical protein
VNPATATAAETAKWLNPRGFVRWLIEAGVIFKLPDGRLEYPWSRGDDEAWVTPEQEGFERRIREWHRGAAPCSIWSADKLLTHLNRHVSELPDSLFIERETNGRRP